MLKWILGVLVVLAAGAAAAWWWLNRPLLIRHPEFGTDCSKLVSDANLDRQIDCVRVWYGTNRSLELADRAPENGWTDVEAGTGESGGQLKLGRADIWLPKLTTDGGTRALGETPHVQGTAPSDPNELADYVFLTRITTAGRTAFTTTLQAAVDADQSGSILLFVHGFNVKFDDALVRAAQLSHDLSSEQGFSVGAPVLYSWPSAGSLSLEDYQGDRARSLDAAPHLEAFLDILTEDLDVSRINIIAHSMGNRVLTQSLQDYASDYLEQHDRGDDLEFRILLVAADVEREIFDSANSVFDNLDANVTIYTSDTDRALHLSNLISQKKRLGDTDTNRPYIRSAQNYQTIDATAVTTELFGVGHNYYSDNPTILWDMMCTIAETAPNERALEIARFGGEPQGAQYYRVNTKLSPQRKACKLQRTAFPTTEPLADQPGPPIPSRSRSIPLPSAPEPDFAPQQTERVIRFYVENYDSLDLTAYVADLEQSIADGTEIERISIRVYSDTVGTSEDNLDRTQRFADAVKSWLIERGIPADRIQAEGLGETELAIDTEDEVDQPLNRYVEIEITR